MNVFPEQFEDISLTVIEQAAALIRPWLPVTALEKMGPVWVKFESDHPTGAFKIRGGLVYFHWLKTLGESFEIRNSKFEFHAGVIAATRGNHGQSVAFAAREAGMKCRIVVPEGNSPSKNRAMRELGAELIEKGRDFAEALEHARNLAMAEKAHFVPSFDWKLALGVSTYGWEMFRQNPEIDAVYVPIGLGSGICGTIAARNALNSRARIIGVVAARAPAYAHSFRAGRAVPSAGIPSTIADGVACRIPVEESLAVILRHAEDVVEVGESAIEDAIREIHALTGRRAEGAGAIAYAAWRASDKRHACPAVIVSGQNMDDEPFNRIINNR